jgi:hypothetical protein
MTPEERNLCCSLTIGPRTGRCEISKEEFLRRFPTAVEDSKLALGLLEKAYKEENDEDLEWTLIVGFSFGFAPKHADLLCKLVEADWHHSHENIVSALTDLRSFKAVGPLEKTAYAHYDYLDYDECFGLARKCVWALADIGTAEAHQALTRISRCENLVIAGYANKRLTNWQTELHRKGTELAGQ